MSPTFVLRHATPWFIYFRPTLNYTALGELSWNFTWWFKLLKVLVPICETTFRCSSCFQGFYQYAGGSSPFMSLLPTKLLMNREDITADHRDVPAIRNRWTVDQAVTLRCFTAICQRFPMDLQFHDPVLVWRRRNRECELPYWDTSSYIFRSALQPFEVIQSVVVHFIVLHSSEFYQICAHSSGNAIFYKRTCQRSPLTLSS